MKSFATLVAALLTLFTVSSTMAADVETLTVDNTTNSGNFSTIQSAINEAQNRLNAQPSKSLRIFVKASATPYSGPITPISNVPIIGERTSGTFIANSGTTPLITISNVANVSITNFTFKTAATAISITSSSSVTISNNVFLQLTGTAVQVTASPTQTAIVNNTFYNNATAISTTSDIRIVNNIFSNNRTRAILAEANLTSVSYNDYFPTTQIAGVNLDNHSLPNSLVPDADPMFVDAVGGDFHLKSGSPCIDAGNPDPQYDDPDGSISDMGAYGGPSSDAVSTAPTSPAAVTGVTSSVGSTSPLVVKVGWTPSGNSSVTAYRVYYGFSSGQLNGTGATERNSPVTVTNRATNSATLTFNPAPATPPAPTAAPVLAAPVPGDHTLLLSWSAVDNATGYLIYYSTASFDSSSLPSSPPPVKVEGGSATSYLLTGLSNGTTYFVRVAPVAEAKVFAAVTAVIDPATASSPGDANESPLSAETSVAVSPPQPGPASNLRSDFPEASAPFPNLKGGGCFIATAAYGFYSAPQVQALRLFRDRYLMTNAPGRAFVSWYYRHGPAGARYLMAHPWLKVPVRIALFPLVALAVFLVYTSAAMKGGVVGAVLVGWSLRGRWGRGTSFLANGGRRLPW